MLSRIAGFVRDLLTAAILGAGPLADAFFVALKLPNLFRRITGEGAFSVAFVPMFSSMEESKGREEALTFAGRAQSVMILFLLPFTIFMIIGMPYVINVITPGFADDPVRYAAAVELSRITFPYILFISLVALYGGVLNSLNRFAAFAVAPVFFNLAIIMALIVAMNTNKNPAYLMALAVSISGVVQLVWMFLCTHYTRARIPWKKPVFNTNIRKMFRLMGPACLGAGVMQVNIFIDMLLASFLEKGAISYLYYADRLYQLPHALIGGAIGTALLPMLSRALKAGDDNKSALLSRQAFLYSLILAVPATFALMALAPLIMTVLFERGEFTQSDSLASAAALRAYAIGLPAFILVKIYSMMFYANQDTVTPVKCAFVAMIINTVLGVILIFPLAHVGIAMSTAIAGWANVWLLSRRMPKNEHSKKKHEVLSVYKIIMSAAIMGGVLFFGYISISPQTFVQNLFTLIAIMAAGGGLYFACLHMTGVMKIQDFKRIFQKKAI